MNVLCILRKTSHLNCAQFTKMILYIEIFCITCYNYSVNQIFADDRRFDMKKRFAFIALILVFAMLGMTACGLIPTPENPPEQGGENPDPHQHNFVEGKCECGETDPGYQPPHEHNFVEGKCECGETDPNYVPPCNHEDADGNLFCDSCGADLIPENMERVSYSLNISDLEAGTRAADEINGKFTIVSGTEVRNRTKTYNGAIGVDSERNSISSVAEWAKDAGVGVGIATSVGINHATPASFYAHANDRNSYEKRYPN